MNDEKAVSLELLYRRTQRQLGEAQVAMGLLAKLAKAYPGDATFERASSEAHQVKAVMMRRVMDLEARVFGAEKGSPA